MPDATLGAGGPGLAAQCTWGVPDTARPSPVAPIVVSCRFGSHTDRPRRPPTLTAPQLPAVKTLAARKPAARFESVTVVARG